MMVKKLFLIQNSRSLGNFETRKRACYNLIAVLLQNKNQKPPLPTRHSTRSIYDNRKSSECKLGSLWFETIGKFQNASSILCEIKQCHKNVWIQKANLQESLTAQWLSQIDHIENLVRSVCRCFDYNFFRISESIFESSRPWNVSVFWKVNYPNVPVIILVLQIVENTKKL